MIHYRAEPVGARPCVALTYGILEKVYIIARSLSEHARPEGL